MTLKIMGSSSFSVSKWFTETQPTVHLAYPLWCFGAAIVELSGCDRDCVP